MKLFVLFSILISSLASATECTLYKGEASYTIIGTVSAGLIYDGPYSNTAIAHFDEEGEFLYQGEYGHKAIGRREGNTLYKHYGYSILGRFEGCVEEDFKPL